MTVGTAYPSNEPTRAQGSWAAYGTSIAQVWATYAQSYLSDSNDLTWVQSTSLPSGGGNSVITSALGNTSIGTNQIVRVRGVARFGGTGTVASFRVLNADGAIVSEATGPVFGASVKTYAGAWAFNPTAGTVWAAATVDAMTMRTATNSTSLQVQQLRLEFDYYATPTGTPTSATPNTDRPAISWTFAQSDSLTQSSAHVKVFSAAQYGAPGFDPATSVSLYSTVVAGNGLTVTPASAILVDTLVYKPYVQVIADSFSIPVKSAWTPSAVAYTASFTSPTAPTLSAVWSDTTTGTAQKAFVVTIAGSASPYRYNLFRNDEQIVFGATMPTSAGAESTAVFIDRGRNPVSAFTRYAAQIVTGPAATPQLSSGTTNFSLSTTYSSTWEISNADGTAFLTDYASSVSSIAFTKAEANAVFRPLNSTKSVVVSGAMTGDDGTIEWITSTDSQWQKVYDLLTYQGPLRISSPFRSVDGGPETYIVRLTSRDWKPEGTPGGPVRRVTANFVEVDPLDTSVV